MTPRETAEGQRLADAAHKRAHWQRWGPYLSDRQWGTVREDYSEGGTAWEYLPHDHARSRAYRWGEDGLFGISDNHQRLCFAPTLWNEKDPILKERLYGLTGNEGNHGEDVKECYFYLDSTPTHSYMKALYKYPQSAFPYSRLKEENGRRTRSDPEFELIQTGVFDQNRYFDIFVEYAKGDVNDILIQITVINRGPETARLHLLPTLWFRNTWSWGRDPEIPSLRLEQGHLVASHISLGNYRLAAAAPQEFLFTNNETNNARLFNATNKTPFVKDAFHRYLIEQQRDAINPAQEGTKAALHYERSVQPGESWALRFRLQSAMPSATTLTTEFDTFWKLRQQEADAFYSAVLPVALGEDEKKIERQALAGLLWCKQFYHFIVKDWLEGDPGNPLPPDGHRFGRNRAWTHLYSEDVLSMPDNWEYPWFAAWDLGFHCIPFSIIDPNFAKRQLELLTREWYMHPNGQIPAYEWAFGDVNPPVHAWAAWRVYQIDKKASAKPDLLFLERVFQKLLLNFTWWVNRKDAEGNNIFQGGFLGLDNIGVFDRNQPLPGGAYIEQSDGTSWMAMYCLNMLKISVELAYHSPAYEDIASKFFEHFLYISEAMRGGQGNQYSLWDESDGFFYDTLHASSGDRVELKVRSVVGLIPLFAVETLEPRVFEKLPAFARRLNWFLQNRPDLAKIVMGQGKKGVNERQLLSLVTSDMLRRILQKMLDPSEFLSDHGVRSLSKFHLNHPFELQMGETPHRISYEPAESQTGFFGGNSNWRGPVWIPVNFLLVESLQKFHHYLGDSFKVECPTGSGKWLSLQEVATELSHRLIALFQRDKNARRPVFGGEDVVQNDPLWRDHLLFYEYFQGDNGAGLGASHQTGWTGLIAKLLQQCGEHRV